MTFWQCCPSLNEIRLPHLVVLSHAPLEHLKCQIHVDLSISTPVDAVVVDTMFILSQSAVKVAAEVDLLEVVMVW